MQYHTEQAFIAAVLETMFEAAELNLRSARNEELVSKHPWADTFITPSKSIAEDFGTIASGKNVTLTYRRETCSVAVSEGSRSFIFRFKETADRKYEYDGFKVVTMC